MKQLECGLCKEYDKNEAWIEDVATGNREPLAGDYNALCTVHGSGGFKMDGAAFTNFTLSKGTIWNNIQKYKSS